MNNSHQVKQSLKKKIEMAPIDSLKPYKKNSRSHSEAQIDKIVASITEFGFTNPILIDGNKQIIAGHGRVMAGKKMGLTEVPVISLDYLSEAQKRAYVIADNKIALDSDWDLGLLASELKAITDDGFDIELTGFSSDELSAMLNGPGFEPGSEDDQGQLDEKQFVFMLCPHCGEKFEKGQASVLKD